VSNTVNAATVLPHQQPIRCGWQRARILLITETDKMEIRP
jgi:hypothetical protein